MEKSQINEAKMFVNAGAYAESLVAGHFTHTPPKKVDTTHATTLTSLHDVIEGLGGKRAIQEGGKYHLETGHMRATRAQIEKTLRLVNRAVSTEARQRRQPELMKRFRMPHGHGDGELRARLASFADALEELGLAGLMEDHGSPITPASLRAMAGTSEGGSGEQGTARATQAGATASIPELLQQGHLAVAILDSIYQNVFLNDVEKLAAWRTASHVERPDAPAAPETPPPPTGGGTPKP